VADVSRVRTLLVGAAVAAGAVASGAGHARAQSQAPARGQTQAQPKVTVRVRQVAGNTVYLDIGTRHGLATGDTLRAALDSLGPPAGRLVVTASTETMSVLTFVGAPLPVGSGAPLTLWLLREPVEVPPPQAVAPPMRPLSARTGASAPPSEAGVLGQPHGRIGFDLSGVRSATQVGGLNPSSSVMRFATPGLVFDATVPDLGGGFSLRTNLRASYRYSSGDIISPATSVRVYSAVVEKDFQHAPLRLAVGRFLSPEEVYSGFWDGGYLRVGGRSVGVGAMVGFEPDQWDERPSSKYPKATVFADAQRQGNGWQWHVDASATAMRPRDSLPDHTFVGFSQRVSTRWLYLSEDLQVDRNPTGGRWRVSWLQLRSSVSVGGGFRVSAGASRRESWSPWLAGWPFLPRNDRLDAGLGFWRGAGGLSADASVNRDASGRKSYGATAAYSVTRLPGLGPVGTSGTVTRWSGPFGSTLSAAPSLTLALTPAWLRLGYRYSRSDYLRSALTTNTVESSLDVPFATSMRLSLMVSESWGGVLSSQYLYLSLYRIF
jgi:hypothetical protein